MLSDCDSLIPYKIIKSKTYLKNINFVFDVAHHIYGVVLAMLSSLPIGQFVANIGLQLFKNSKPL